MLAISPGVVIADYAQLLKDVAAVVRHEMQHAPLPTPISAGVEDEPLTVDKAAELFNVTKQTIHEWKRRGLFGFYKMGGRTYLKRAEVLAAMKSQQRTVKLGKK